MFSDPGVRHPASASLRGEVDSTHANEAQARSAAAMVGAILIICVCRSVVIRETKKRTIELKISRPH
jgi:hypothetical protein